jgi:two-component system, NarL family, invasion response regulator UvrY
MTVEIRVAVVDDHAMMRSGFKRAAVALADIRVIAEADTAAGAIRLCERRDIDVLVLDADLPDFAVVDVVAEIARRAPDLKLVVVLPAALETFVIPLAKLGVLGMVTKVDSLDALLEAVRVVSTGKFHSSAIVAETMLAYIVSGRTHADNRYNLSPRELQTVRLVVAGKSSKAIAQLFGISDVTVRGYRKEIYRKMGCNSVSSLVAKAYETGIVSGRAALAADVAP